MNERLEIGTDIDDIFRQAQKAYNKWSRLEPDERTTERLLDSLSFDFFQLLINTITIYLIDGDPVECLCTKGK